MATQLIDALSGDWKPEQYRDTYADELRDRIERKQEGEEIVVNDEDEQPTATLIDLSEALQRSIDAADNKRRKSRRRAASGKR